MCERGRKAGLSAAPRDDTKKVKWSDGKSKRKIDFCATR
jgi:hypothetical protein